MIDCWSKIARNLNDYSERECISCPGFRTWNIPYIDQDLFMLRLQICHCLLTVCHRSEPGAFDIDMHIIGHLNIRLTQGIWQCDGSSCPIIAILWQDFCTRLGQLCTTTHPTSHQFTNIPVVQSSGFALSVVLAGQSQEMSLGSPQAWYIPC